MRARYGKIDVESLRLINGVVRSILPDLCQPIAAGVVIRQEIVDRKDRVGENRGLCLNSLIWREDAQRAAASARRGICQIEAIPYGLGSTIGRCGTRGDRR